MALSIRPERIAITSPGGGFDGAVERLVYLGTDTQAVIRLDAGQAVTVRAQNAHGGGLDAGPGDRVGLVVDPGAARVLTS